jgi:hypothetical protein
LLVLRRHPERSEGSLYFAIAVVCFAPSSWSEAKDPRIRRCLCFCI